MSYDDFWYDTIDEIKRLGIQKEFDNQLKKMSSQDKHKYKDTRDRWRYALDKVKERNKNTSE